MDNKYYVSQEIGGPGLRILAPDQHLEWGWECAPGIGPLASEGDARREIRRLEELRRGAPERERQRREAAKRSFAGMSYSQMSAMEAAEYEEARNNRIRAEASARWRYT